MKPYLYISAVVAVGALMLYVGWDVLTSPPTLQEGTIVELFDVPPKTVAGHTPVVGRSIGNQMVIATKQAQWIAVVRGDSSEFQVHCTEEHYNQLHVGDVLKYKKYEGEVFHIKYFAHYEDH